LTALLSAAFCCLTVDCLFFDAFKKEKAYKAVRMFARAGETHTISRTALASIHHENVRLVTG